MKRRPRLPILLAATSGAVIIFGWLCFHLFGDRFWWALPILFGPRWIWLLPLTGFLPILGSRRGALAGGVATLLVVLGIIDFRLGFGRIWHGEGMHLRVMEINDEGSGRPDQPGLLLAEIARVSPDIVVIAECGTGLRPALEHSLPGFTFRAAQFTALCLYTRGTIKQWDERDPADAWKQSGSGAIIRAELGFPGGDIRLGMVHLATPRSALAEFQSLHSIPTLGPATTAETAERETESAEAVAWIDRGGPLPVIIAGDFNTPVESAIYARYWGDFRNAFSETGIGTGYSKHTTWWGIRIDHILTSPDVRPASSFIGSDVGSDHLPVIADLVIPYGTTASPR